MTSVRVDEQKCVRCRTCVDCCFICAMEWDGQLQRPYLKYGDDCQICGVCETLCPAGALYIQPDWQAKHQPRLLVQGREKS